MIQKNSTRYAKIGAVLLALAAAVSFTACSDFFDADLSEGLSIDPGVAMTGTYDGYTCNTGTPRIAYKISSGRIDVIGSVDGGTNWGKSTYANGGWYFMWGTTSASIDATNGTGQIISGVTYRVTPKIVNTTVSGEEKSYIMFEYRITNSNTETATVQFGSYADTQVGSADNVDIYHRSYGLSMSSSPYTFALYLKNSAGVTDVSTLWAGSLGSVSTNLYINLSSSIGVDALAATAVDSAAAYSWKDVTIAPGATVIKRARLALGTL